MQLHLRTDLVGNETETKARDGDIRRQRCQEDVCDARWMTAAVDQGFAIMRSAFVQSAFVLVRK